MLKFESLLKVERTELLLILFTLIFGLFSVIVFYFVGSKSKEMPVAACVILVFVLCFFALGLWMLSRVLASYGVVASGPDMEKLETLYRGKFKVEKGVGLVGFCFLLGGIVLVFVGFGSTPGNSFATRMAALASLVMFAVCLIVVIFVRANHIGITFASRVV
jgi:hypothetical protein